MSQLIFRFTLLITLLLSLVFGIHLFALDAQSSTLSQPTPDQQGELQQPRQQTENQQEKQELTL